MLWRGKLAGLRFESSWQLPIALIIWLGASGDLSAAHRRDGMRVTLLAASSANSRSCVQLKE